jgi:hypothetical protein
LDGILLLADDVNIDMLKHNNPDTKVTKRYTEVLDSLNLTQVVIPRQQEQLNLLKPAAVLPCPLVSDHDAPYVTVNARVSHYQPMYKFIRNEKWFNETSFVDNFTALPFEVVYALEQWRNQPNELVPLCKF